MDQSTKRLRESSTSGPDNRKRIKVEREDVKLGEQIAVKKEDQVYIDEWVSGADYSHVLPSSYKPVEPVRMRDGQARDEEFAGILTWEVIANDGSRVNLKKLMQLKQIISAQLPKMPRNYIVRLVFDNQHRSLIATKDGKIIGGITFRPFHKEGCVSSIEIVFCVITAEVQRGGYGSRLMNQLKHWCRENEYYHLLTYADDTAIGYFHRQGFSQEIGMTTEEWDIGYLKYYDSATLMHCQVDPAIEYLSATACLRIQRANFYKKMRELSNQHIIYPGVNFETGKTAKNLHVPVQGLIDAGWCQDNLKRLLSDANQRKIYQANKELLDAILNDPESEPFSAPVVELHPDLSESYVQVISDPIDLRTIEERLEDGYYITPEMMLADLNRMVENCKTFLKHIYEGNKQKLQKLDKDPLFVQAEGLSNRYLKTKKEQLGVITPTVQAL